MPVWALIGYAAAVHGDLGRVAQDCELPLPAVLAAVFYYEQHRGAIHERMAANN